MRVNIDGTAKRKKYPDLNYYDECDGHIIDIIHMGSMEMSEHIGSKLSHRPSGKLLMKWKQEINSLIDNFNDRFGAKYKRVK